MKRRLALQHIITVSGGIAFLSGCTFDSKRALTGTYALNLDASHEELLAAIVDTIIPGTDVPGARELNLHRFVLTMVDECRDKESQEIFVTGLHEIDVFTVKTFSASFSEGTQEGREGLLNQILQFEEGQDAEFNVRNIKRFLTMTRDLTVKGYTTSKYFMTEVVRYALVPGHYSGCVPVR